jgi:hypothetical protein
MITSLPANFINSERQGPGSGDKTLEAAKGLHSHLRPTYFPTQRVVSVKQALPYSCLDQLFRNARTYNGWTDRAVDDQLLGQHFTNY